MIKFIFSLIESKRKNYWEYDCGIWSYNPRSCNEPAIGELHSYRDDVLRILLTAS
jgi:hypothetical protein